MLAWSRIFNYIFTCTQSEHRTLIKEDAKVVCQAWFPISIAPFLTTAMVQKEAKELGLGKDWEKLKQW